MIFKPHHFDGLEEDGRTFKAKKKPITVDVHGPVNQRQEIRTREGVIVAEKDDYIIRGVNGEVYPIGPDIFNKSYEVLE